MPNLAHVTVDPSQFPENVRRDLIEGLCRRAINHKFNYDSIKQTQQWLALHQACSPSRIDDDCAAIYDRSFAAVAERTTSPRVHLVGLGCGGGQKDTRLLKLLQADGKKVSYTPVDVSTAMVLVARQTALEVVPESACSPLVCDLATAIDLAATLDQLCGDRFAAASRITDHQSRIITFFGMIPNFEPGVILPKLASIVGPDDVLLFSANLAPGADYSEGVRTILPLYDNVPTREWLMTFLTDLGVARSDGDLQFRIEDDPQGSGLKRVAAYFQFNRACSIRVDEEIFRFAIGEQICLFFSYRHTPALVRWLLGEHGIDVIDQWITKSGEEGVFLCVKTRAGYPARL